MDKILVTLRLPVAMAVLNGATVVRNFSRFGDAEIQRDSKRFVGHGAESPRCSALNTFGHFFHFAN